MLELSICLYSAPIMLPWEPNRVDRNKKGRRQKTGICPFDQSKLNVKVSYEMK